MTPTQSDEEYKKQVDMIISWLMVSPKEYHHINSAKIRLYDVVQYFSQQKLEAVKRESMLRGYTICEYGTFCQCDECEQEVDRILKQAEGQSD